MKTKPHDHKTFGTGAQRSDRTGKGRFDLIAPNGLKRLAVQYEAGAEHHGDPRNWMLGFPISRAICSALGHINDHLSGDRGEDHLAAAAWQILAAMEFEVLIEQGKLPVELNDVPFDSNTLPPDTGAESWQNPPLQKVASWEGFDVIAKVDIPADAEVWCEVEIHSAIIRGQIKGEIVKIDGKFILRKREDCNCHRMVARPQHLPGCRLHPNNIKIKTKKVTHDS